MKSCLRFPEYSFLEIDGNGEIVLDHYRARFERRGVITEYDWRFAERFEVQRLNHKSHSLYGNMLDEPLDYIGYFEDLPRIVEFLRDKPEIKSAFSHHAQASSSELSKFEVPEASREKIQKLFWRDYLDFDFQSTTSGSDMDHDVDAQEQSALSGTDKEIEDLQDRISDLLVYRDSYRKTVDEFNVKNKVIASLHETVAQLVTERDSLSNQIKARNEAAAVSKKRCFPFGF